MSFSAIRCAAAALVLCTPAWAQGPGDFSWRGRLQVPPQASLVRVPLPASALMRLQAADAADLRVFDAKGQPVPFALANPQAQPAPPRDQTQRYAALAMSAAQPQGTAAASAVQVRIEEGGTRRSVWVQTRPAAPSGAQASLLPSVLFDTRAEKREIAAIALHAQLRPNRPVQPRVSTSADLVEWAPVAVRGSLFRFEGDGAPANDTLELVAPMRLQGRYLRIDWDAEEAISVQGMTGLAAAATVPLRVAATLPAPTADGPAALEWELGFATPIREFRLSTQKSNTLVPVRILGRNAVSEPWRQLALTVVWRLGVPGRDHVNPATALPGASVRWLRVEATHGMRLEGIPLMAEAAFDPLQLVFVAGGEAPYEVAAGRAATPAAALPLSMLANASSVKVDELPAATFARVEAAPPGQRSGVAAWLPRGVEPRTALLWAVLGGGVLLLGGVAWSLLRQLNRGDSPPAA
jgi:hypothetical protein